MNTQRSLSILIQGPRVLFFIVGHVGPPLPCNIVKLVDVEDMNYFAAKGEGEVKKNIL